MAFIGALLLLQRIRLKEKQKICTHKSCNILCPSNLDSLVYWGSSGDGDEMSVSLEEETGVPERNHRPTASN